MCVCVCVCAPCRQGQSCLKELKGLTLVQRFSVGVMFLSSVDKEGECAVCLCVLSMVCLPVCLCVCLHYYVHVFSIVVGVHVTGIDTVL